MEKMTLTFVNVGYGEAILLECPDPRFADGMFTMLIDGGGAGEFADRSSGRIPLAEYLRDRGFSHIDLMACTHIHEDHVSGALPAAELLPPRALWQALPAAFYRSMRRLDCALAKTPSQDKFIRALNDYQALCGLVEGRGGQVRTVLAGGAGYLCAGLSYRVLAPSGRQARALEEGCRGLFEGSGDFLERLSALDGQMNNFSLVLLLDYKGTRVLLPGDTSAEGYDGVDPAGLAAHLFKIGHHGQRDGVSRWLAEAVRPRAAVCCASSDRRYDSAHPDALRLLAERGAALYFSDAPAVEGQEIPPHQALAFSIGPGGSFDAAYL